MSYLSVLKAHAFRDASIFGGSLCLLMSDHLVLESVVLIDYI